MSHQTQILKVINNCSVVKFTYHFYQFIVYVKEKNVLNKKILCFL